MERSECLTLRLLASEASGAAWQIMIALRDGTDPVPALERFRSFIEDSKRSHEHDWDAIRRGINLLGLKFNGSTFDEVVTFLLKFDQPLSTPADSEKWNAAERELASFSILCQNLSSYVREVLADYRRVL